jgi:chromosome segregation ATPase
MQANAAATAAEEAASQFSKEQLQAATARIHALQRQLSDVQEVQKQQQLKEAALAAQLAHAQQALQQQQHATEAAKAQLESALAASPLLADTHFLQQQLAAANARAEELEMQLMSGSASREALRQELLKELAATQAQAKETLQGLAQETEALRAKVSASPLLLIGCCVLSI